MFLNIIPLRSVSKVELRLLNLALVFGIHNAFDDLFDDVEVRMYEDEVNFVDVFDIFSEISALLVYHLARGDDF